MKHSINQCSCCHTSINRRDFLKFSVAALSMSILQPNAIAQASSRTKALVLSCIDFRFLTAERYFLAERNLWGNYDWTALAGASLAVTGFPHPADAEAFWDQLDLSHRLHNIEKVIILDHQDCGAYAAMIDPNLSKDPQRELEVHKNYLNQAYWSIRDRYPQLKVELYLATLNQAEFITILPGKEKITIDQ
jgi:carbonic anhydrase